MKKIAKTMLAMLVAATTYGQAGYSNASVGQARHEVVRKADEIFLEEYFNYRRHGLPVPTATEKVHLDLSWGSDRTTEQGEAVLQVGISTARQKEDEMAPVNICVVLDRSGSMAGDRIRNTREATKELVNRLRPIDRLSIVLFDNQAEILLPSQLVTDKSKILKVVEQVHERGGTNLNAGLQLGYKEVAAHYADFPSNKIVFLTDAMANLGVTDPYEMLRQAGVYQKQMQIDLTLIGVGENFDAVRARALTSKGHTVHFVMDSREIKKIFIDELESLLAPIGREVSLELEWSPEMQLKEFYGYTAQANTQKIVLPLNNMNAGLTQIALLDFKLTDKRGQVKAKLVWKDAISQQPREISLQTSIKAGHEKSTLEDNADLRLNYRIAKAAQNLQNASKLYYSQNASAALVLLDATIQQIKDLQPQDDIEPVLDALKTMKKTIEKQHP